MFTKKSAWLAVIVLATFGGVAYWQREAILAWHYVRQLSSASDESRERWAKKVAGLGEAALPALLRGLGDADPHTCRNVQYGLFLVAKEWGPDDARTHQMAEHLRGRFDDFSPPGQENALLLLANVLRLDGPRPLPPRLTQIVSDTLVHAEKSPDNRPAALLLAAELVDVVQPGQWVDVCRGMAERGLKDESADARVAALKLLQREPMRKEKDLIARAAEALRDPSPAVRKAALIALAGENEIVREEHFLPLLHDADLEVQYLCEIALRKRGLHDDDLRVARLISDKNPAKRLRVLSYLPRMPELNLTEWLRRLSQDPSPAVRAAAVRAAAEYPQVDLTPRLREMAQRDPSETVRQNAIYYLNARAIVRVGGR